jgi:hypothetical protein
MICLCLLLSSCTNLQQTNSHSLNIPEEVFYSCPDLPIAISASESDLLKQSGETFKMYQECRKWNEEKNKILKQLKERKIYVKYKF